MKIFNLRARILAPLTLVSVVVLCAYIVGIYHIEQEHLDEDVARSIQAVQGYYQATLKERANKLGATLAAIADDKELRRSLAKQDRNQLLVGSEKIYNRLRSKYNVTHFYFHNPNRINILRVHQPGRYGDTINRYTALGAEKTKTLFYGAELGPLGTFTFRVVLPVIEEGRLIGYIELGEEIDQIVTDMEKVFDVDLIVTIDKRYLKHKDWVAGMALLGRKADWNSLPRNVIISQTFDAIPQRLTEIISMPTDVLHEKNIELNQKQRFYRGSVMPLRDAGERAVGSLTVLRDMSARISSSRDMVTVISSGATILGVGLFVLFYFILDRTEHNLLSATETLKRHQSHLTEAQKIGRMGSWEFDLRSKQLMWSDQVYRMFNINPAVFTANYDAFMDMVHPDDQCFVKQAFNESIDTGAPYDVVYRIILPDGKVKYIRELCKIKYDASDQPIIVSGTVQDISEQRQAEMQSARMGRILEHSWNEIYAFDTKDFHFVDVSDGACQNLGYSMEELSQKTALDIKPGFTRKEFELLIAPLKNGTKSHISFEAEHQRKDGTCYPVEVRLQLSTAEEPPVYIAIIQDISERKHYIEELEHKALYDLLTDLPNHALLQDRLDHALKVADRDASPLSVLTVDILRLGEINDLMGRDQGDIVLKETASRLKKVLRESDTIARLGGDVFALILPSLNMDDIHQVAGKIKQLFEQPVVVEETPLEIEIAIGVAQYPEHGKVSSILLQHADVAMRVAKNETSLLSIYNPDDDPYSLKYLRLHGELRQAINNRMLELYYQPKIDIKTGRVKSVEALARWPHPSDGIISPEDFIPMVEQSGMIHQFTLWVVEEALKQSKCWIDAGISLEIAINLSTRNLLDPGLPVNIEDLLETYRVSPDHLSLEITESSVMARPESSLILLRRLHDMGLALSIDDFGTGYSSLAYLKKLPVQELKIDQSFIFGLTTNEDDAVIVRSTIDMAHNLGLTVVAEGVESQDILNKLKTLGCDIAQGYFFSRPVPAEEMTCWLSESEWGLEAKPGV